LRDYIGIDVEKRKTNIVDIPVEMIRSGDTFYVRRHDGLPSFISWGMGTNHSIFFIKII
jgi:hypothetical protein